MDLSPSRRKAIQQLTMALVPGIHGMLGPQTAAAASTRKAKPIKIGQIGVGHAHASKLEKFRQSADYEVVGIVEPDEALRKAAQSKAPFQGLPWMTQEQLLNTAGLDVVLIETRVAQLLENAQACIEAGVHIGIDKPAGDSLPRFKRILYLAAAKKKLVQMGYMYRYNPGVIVLREFLQKGWLGDVFEVHAVMSKVVDPVDRKKFAAFPGGMMFELGCHVLDLVIGVLGKPANVTGYLRHQSALDDGLMDNTLAVLEYPKALATIKATALEVDGFDRRHLVVCGTEGTVHIQPLDDPKMRISLSKARGGYKKGTQEVPLPKYSRYVGDAADMARIIRGEKATDFPYAHDLTVQETLLKACRLDEEGKPIR